MNHKEPVKAAEITDIDGQQLPNAVDIHARCQTRVMDLHALNVMRDQKGNAIAREPRGCPAGIQNRVR
jgi:hypothetical protein